MQLTLHLHESHEECVEPDGGCIVLPEGPRPSTHRPTGPLTRPTTQLILERKEVRSLNSRPYHFEDGKVKTQRRGDSYCRPLIECVDTATNHSSSRLFQQQQQQQQQPKLDR